MKRVAIAYSGGLDSYLAFRYAEDLGHDVVLFHVDLGHPQAQQERLVIEREQGLGRLLVAMDVKLMQRADYRGLEDSPIVPGRNLTFAVLGAHLAPEIWICAAAGERHPYSNRDKSVEWYHATSAALSYSWQPLRPETTVVAPLGHLTKAKALGFGMQDLGVTADDVSHTWSCYERAWWPACGRCAACFHRWIATEANGIEEEWQWPPWWSKRADQELAEAEAARLARDFTYYTEQRIEETLTYTFFRRGFDLANRLEPAHVRDSQDV